MQPLSVSSCKHFRFRHANTFGFVMQTLLVSSCKHFRFRDANTFGFLMRTLLVSSCKHVRFRRANTFGFSMQIRQFGVFMQTLSVSSKHFRFHHADKTLSSYLSDSKCSCSRVYRLSELLFVVVCSRLFCHCFAVVVQCSLVLSLFAVFVPCKMSKYAKCLMINVLNVLVR